MRGRGRAGLDTWGCRLDTYAYSMTAYSLLTTHHSLLTTHYSLVPHLEDDLAQRVAIVQPLQRDGDRLPGAPCIRVRVRVRVRVEVRVRGGVRVRVRVVQAHSRTARTWPVS